MKCVFVSMCSMASLQAQDAELTPRQTGTKKFAYVRAWAVLGDMASKDTFSLWDISEMSDGNEPKKTIVFSGVKGCRRTGYGFSYSRTTAGKRKFVLVRDTPVPTTVDEVEAEIEGEAAFSILAILDGGLPKLRLIPEHPAPPEQDGIYVYKLLMQAPLYLQIGDKAPIAVSYSGTQPLVLVASQLMGQPVALIYYSKKQAEIRQEIDYVGKGRVSAVFMRNSYSKPCVFIYPSEPDK